MSKAFTREQDNDDELDEAVEPVEPDPTPGVKNYITPRGLQRLRDELKFLLTGSARR